MKWLTVTAVFSFCLSAIMVPFVALIVWLRRKKDPTEVIQEDDVSEDE